MDMLKQRGKELIHLFQPHMSPECRIDPENLNPAAQREAIQKGQEAELPEPGTRVELFGVLDETEDVQQKELIEILESQYHRALAVWRRRRSINLNDAPTQERIAAWLAKLSPKTLNGILKFKDTARLVLVPPVSATDLIDEGTVPGVVYWREGWQNAKTETWTFGITSVKEDMPFDPTLFYKNPDEPNERKRIKRTNEEMTREAKSRFESAGMTIMPQYAYVSTHTRVKAECIRLDRQFYAAFEQPEGADYVPRADSVDFGEVLLSGVDPDHSSENLRCRPWVGEMENN